MRMHGHAEHDPADYVPREMFEEWRKKDPVELFERELVDNGVISDATSRRRPGKRLGSTRSTPARRRSRIPMPDGEHGGGRCLCRLTPTQAE